MYGRTALSGGAALKVRLVVGENGAEAVGNEPVKPPPPSGGGAACIVDVSFTVKLAVDDRPTSTLKN